MTEIPRFDKVTGFAMKTMYAVIQTGGKQYKVAAGQKVTIDKLDAAEGSAVEFSDVLLIADGEKTVVGTPAVDGAKVTATCVGQKRTDKIIVFKYKNKVRYKRKTGHRQSYSTVEIQEIVKPGGGSVKKARKKKEAAGGEG